MFAIQHGLSSKHGLLEGVKPSDLPGSINALIAVDGLQSSGKLNLAF